MKKRFLQAGAVLLLPGLLLLPSLLMYRGKITKDRELVIHIVGDIMLSRGVQDYLYESGYDYPYTEVAPLFRGDDLTLGNLECPITAEENPASKKKRFLFRADRENAAALFNAGFDCLNLANNHSTDYLSAGLWDTVEALRDVSISTVGAGQNALADTSLVWEKDGYRIGILAFCALPTEGFFYDPSAPTISYVSSYNLEDAAQKIKSLSCDLKIVCFHWGTEYMPYKTQTQEKLAHMAADAGADLVIGAHPHVLGEYELYNGVPIYYSLGNFVFDRQIQPGTDESVILEVRVSRSGIREIKELPCRIRNARVTLLADK